MQLARRLQSFQSNVFNQMDRAKHEARQLDHTILDLSIGSSDLAPPPAAIAAMQESLATPATYGYTLYHQTYPFRVACAQRYERQFGLPLDPDTEVLPLIGSQEGTALITLATLNPGDGAFLTDPCYPSHFDGVHLAEGSIFPMRLNPERSFLPDFNQIPTQQRDRARLMVLCYPNNPTAGTATLDFWHEAVAFCEQYDIILAHDFPYADWVFEGDPAPSVLQVDRNKSRSVEFFSLSKSFHMGGFRVGYAVGNAEILKALATIRSAINFNQYSGILQGATAALESPDSFTQEWLAIYRHRRDLCVAALKQSGWAIRPPRASMYLWIPLPSSYIGSSAQFCIDLVKATGVALAPGSGFGPGGEGYVRLALVLEVEQLQQALDKMIAFSTH